MQRARRLTFLAVAAVIGLGLATVIAWEWQERRFAASVEAIEVGTSRELVLERLGKPGFQGTDCYVAQFVTFEKPSHRPSAQYCAHWLGPSPGFRFYAVGFGPDHKVVWVAYGDS